MRKYDKPGCNSAGRMFFIEFKFSVQYRSFFKDLNVSGNISGSDGIEKYDVYILKVNKQFFKLSTNNTKVPMEN
jgi:hypothetical protein